MNYIKGLIFCKIYICIILEFMMGKIWNMPYGVKGGMNVQHPITNLKTPPWAGKTLFIN